MNHFVNFLKGACMGAADVVPGVSGGTVALLTGIYHRLIRVISSFDRQWVKLLLARRFREAAEHVDWKFVVTLGAGLVTGFVITIRTVGHYLEVDSTRTLILAAFFGMIIAATIIVGQMIAQLDRVRPPVVWTMALAGLVVALLVTQLTPASAFTDPPLWYLFLCGAIAICAMILPGISGALILILLGVYQPLVHRVKSLLQFEDVAANLPVAIVFILGAITGLLLFSRVLRRFLDRYPAPTLALLCGLMVGSLPLLWPFQVNTTPEIEEVKQRIYRPEWPDALDGEFWRHVLVAFAAMCVVLCFDWGSRTLASRQKSTVSIPKGKQDS
ncbi:MAG: DUF368 domain-containing protein [Pirellulaceae bacterium]